MQIRTHMAVSIDGFISTPDGRPAIVALPDFNPSVSHGFPEFLADTGAVLMGRTTFLPALESGRWPWGDMRVYVLTSSPLPEGVPEGVSITTGSAQELLERMRSDEFEGNVHLVGGPRTTQAFRELGALDVLEILKIPFMLGDGVPLAPPGTPQVPLKLERQHTHPDGTVQLSYSLI
jgi:dihydrofolate reductase